MSRSRPIRLMLIAVTLAVSLASPPVASGHDQATQALDANPFRADAALSLAAAAAADVPAGFLDSYVITGLQVPTSVRFAPNGHVFVAEKAGRILEFDSIDDLTPSLYADLRTQVYDYGDRGLLGLEIDPAYSQGRPYVYALYTYDKDPFASQFPRWGDDCPTPPGPTADGCVVSARLSRLAAGGQENVLITDWCQQYDSHSIGDLAFGADGALYVSGGDGASYTFADYGQDGNPINPCGDPGGPRGGPMPVATAEGGALRSQDVRTSGDPTGADGTILRIDPDTGAALPDNPAATSTDAMTRRIVAHGLRNPFRITVRPGTNEVWLGDVGWNTWEEINRVPAPTSGVRNFGWPCYEGAGRMSAYDNLNNNLCESLYTQGATAHSGPYFAYDHGSRVVPNEACGTGTSSISAITFYPGGQFPARYRDGLFFADYARQCIWFMPAGANGLPDPTRVETFQAAAGGPVGMTAGPDGALYVADILNGAIRRISYPSANEAPTARVTATPTSGAAPLTVQFDGRASSDADGDALDFAWDLDGDGAFDDATGAQVQRTYTTPGLVTARLRVTDPSGLTGIAGVQLRIGTPPVARIDTPVTGTTWTVGDELAFSGGGTESGGAAVPAARMSWRLLLQHCADGQQNCHTHTIQTWSGIAGGTFAAPDHEYPSYLELELTVTDANGLTDVLKRRLDPRTVNVTFESNPPGMQLSVGSFTGTAPFVREVIVNSVHSVSAPAPQTVDGTTYAFSSWSDGGAQSHNLTMPATATTFRANYVETTAVPGLVGAWGFDESGGTQALDASGGGAHGAISGASRVAGRFGGALAFDGLDDWVTVADTPALRLGSAMTLEAWVNPAVAGTAWRSAVLKEQPGGLAYALYANNGANRPAGFLNNGPGDVGVNGTAGLALGTWTHVATTYDGASLRIFANGAQVATRAVTGGIRSSTGPLRFGGNAAWLDEFFNGRLDEIRVYDRALSAAQIAADMNQPVSSAPEPARLAVAPASLSFDATQGGANPAAKSVSVTNTGGGSLSYTASDNAPWLSVAPTSGSAPQTLSVSADISGLAPGTHTATVTVTAAGAAGSPASIAVTLTVAAAPAPQLSVSPASLSFAATQGQPAPASKSLSVANTGGGSLSFTASDDAPWLTVSPGSGTAPQTLTVAADQAGLAPGTHNATITVTAAGVAGSPASIPVTLTVAAAPPAQLSVTPSSISFSATAGGPSPATQSLSVANTGGGTLSFTASDDAPWLTVSPASGTAPQTLTVAADQSGLAAGTHNATITVTAAGVAGSPASIAVTLTVAAAPAPQLSVSPASLSFAATQGQPAPASKSLSVANTGGGSLSFTASDDAPWLTVSPGSGTAPQTLTVAANQAGLAAGTHNATITVTAAGVAGSPATIPVSLAVASAPPAGGLVGAYGFEEAGGSTANDGSGSGNVGVISGATRTTAGRLGSALTFDGVNDWVTVADAPSLDLTTAMTLEAWVYPTVGGNLWRTVLLKERPAGLSYALYSSDDGGLPQGFVFTTGDRGARGTAALPLNTWSHLATTYSGTTLRLFVNGAQVASRSAGSPIRASANPLRIGGNAIWDEWFAGRIDEVRVYNRALTAAEIQNDMTRAAATASVALARRGPAASRRTVRRNLRRARRHSRVRVERARRGLPLREHVRRR